MKFQTVIAIILLTGLSGCGPRVDILDLMDKTRSDDPEIAARAQETMDRYVLERQVGLFAGALDSDDPDDRGLALWCLGRIGTPEAIAVIADQLAAERSFPLRLDPVIGAVHLQPRDSRLLVAQLLRRLGPPPGAVDIVLPALTDSDENERLMGVYVLSILMDPSAADQLLPILGDPSDRVARAAVEALGKLRNPVAVNALIALAVDPDAPTRRTALTALQRFQDPAILDPLLKALPGEQDVEILFMMASLIGRYRDPRAVTALIPMLGSEDHNLQRMVESRLCELTHRPPGLSAADWSRWWEERDPDYRFPP